MSETDLSKGFKLFIEVIGIVIAASMLVTAGIQAFYLEKANDIQEKLTSLQDKLVAYEGTHVFPEVIKTVPIKRQIYKNVNEEVILQFEMAYDGERTAKYYVDWLAKHEDGRSSGITYAKKDEKALKLIHKNKGSIIESYKFTFGEKGDYTITANVIYTQDVLESNDPNKSEYDLLMETKNQIVTQIFKVTIA